jgi:hypothetical protein
MTGVRGRSPSDAYPRGNGDRPGHWQAVRQGPKAQNVHALAGAYQLIAGVRTVGAGDALLAPGITRRLIEEFAESAHPLGGTKRSRLRHVEGPAARCPCALPVSDRRSDETAPAPRTRPDTNAGAGTGDDVRLASRQMRVSRSCSQEVPFRRATECPAASPRRAWSVRRGLAWILLPLRCDDVLPRCFSVTRGDARRTV